MNRSPLIRALLVSAALGAAVALPGCNTDGLGMLPMSDKAAQPLSDKMVKAIQAKNMEMESPILVRIYKEESELEVWKQDRDGRFALLKTYPICRWSGELGPKFKEGDRQTPEGFYNITPGQMNPNSAYYLSFDLGYPNAYDRSWGRTGAQLMVHGDCSSRGCYSMTDEQIAEIYALGRDAFFGGQKSFQVQAFPFHMTAQNMARHRNNPNIAFWKMIKKGSDHFEVSGLEPKVNVCEKHYVFDAESTNGKQLTFSASGKCPAYRVSEDIASLVKEKELKDDQQFAELSRRNIATAPVKTYADGGMNEVFMEAVRKNQIGVAPQEATLFVTTPPGTIPAHVRPPAVAELADAPVVAGAKPVPPASGEVSPPAMAIAAAPARSNGGGLFGSLFASKSADPASAEKSEGTLDRMKRLVGLRGADKDKAADAKAKPAAKPPTRVASHGAIRPKPTETEPVKSVEARAPATTTAVATPTAWPAAPAPAAPAPAQKPASGSMNGAAPVVPTGGFDSRWSGFR